MLEADLHEVGLDPAAYLVGEPTGDGR